ncbi:hypothetical protein AMATHDRAFT_38254 [Amanita thiersii Skay4041]|uniref:RNase H type-1 domain-containing protein n=1 Tax=Amanita thiersii Skay4041 TaxID=703135 RepID=A0A2A9P1A7_9AGAR|nr:hypothetical protein AMATHDRAFT_38254 [Amanita thiersii Skay4041]
MERVFDTFPGQSLAFFTDNASALLAATDPDIHSCQFTSLRIASLIRDWMADPRGTIKFSWCPGHSGIPGNETADRLVSSLPREAHREQIPNAQFTLRASFDKSSRENVTCAWR